MSLSQKLALAGGAGAALAGLSAEAVPIQSPTVPISPPANGYANWDVDGDGTTDFRLARSSSGPSATMDGNLNPNNRVIALTRTQFPFDNIAKLASGFAVGASPVAGFNFNPRSSIEMTADGSVDADAQRGGWATGDIGFFGFRFSNTSGLHFGWAELSLHGGETGYTILRSYYNDIAGASINVGDTGAAPVPEIDPASAGSVLSLVMGSLAMLERRRSRRAAGAYATTVSA